VSQARLARLAWALLALGALGACFVVALHPRPLYQFRTVEIALLSLGAIMGLALLAVWKDFVPSRRTAGWVVIGVGLVARCAFAGHEPSNDVFRYLWEGRVQLHGVNPYSTPPADPSLTYLRDAGFEEINHPEWTAIYGPAAQGLFAAIALLSPTVLVWKIVVLLFDLGVIWLLTRLLVARGQSPLWVVGYAWNPLVLWSFAGAAHLEVVVTLALIAALLALERGRAVLAGLALGVGVLVKATSLVALPLLFLPRWRPRALAAFLFIVVVGYLPYAGAGWGLFDSLTRFGGEMRFNDFPGLVFGGLLGPMELGLLAVVAISLVVLWLWSRRTHPVDGATMLLGVSILVLPTVHPWYGAPLAACNSSTRSAAFFVLTVSLVFALETAAQEVATKEWTEPGWVRWAVYGPFLIAAAMEATWRKRSHQR
jgi:alpha-1,6-mannosyltransferase